MKGAELLLKIKKIFIDLVWYEFPTIALVISIFSFLDYRKVGKIQDRLNKVKEKLKKYELEEKKKSEKKLEKQILKHRL